MIPSPTAICVRQLIGQTTFFPRMTSGGSIWGERKKTFLLSDSFYPRVGKSLIVGTFQVDLNIPDQEIQLLISEMVQEESNKRKEVLLETIITETAKGRHGLLRVDDILGAVREGRVQNLLIGEDYHQHGFSMYKL